MEHKKSIVVVGGGTGTYTVLSGLKKYVSAIRLSAIVGVSDSGGSTGRLRDEFGHLPAGDTRMALVALANETGQRHELMRELFLYRFDKGGKDLAGHNFGNLFLTALTEILGSEEEAIKVSGRILRVCGRVFPVSHEHLTLVATYDDGLVTKGEAKIDAPDPDRATHTITNIRVEPSGNITDDARRALCSADMVVLGPGDLYTSVLAVCVVDGVAEALQQMHGTFVYVSNLMTRTGQTDQYGVRHHVDEIARYCGRKPDSVLVNTTPLPEELLKKYHAVGEHPVKDDMGDDPTVVRTDLLGMKEITTEDGDVVRRSFIRHDSDKLAAALMAL